MTVRLRDADARAVDLLLDRAAASAQGNGNGHSTMMFAAGPAASHTGVSNEQIAAVEKVLKVLDAMPAAEPASDLLRRTLERVDAHTDAPLRGGAAAALIGASHPVA